ncbi:MAG: phage holin family protein [Nostocoides sp.]
MSVLLRVAVNAVALWIAAGIIPGIHLADGSADWQSKALAIVLVALVFGVVNAVVKPIADLLSLPAVFLTLGLFTFVVNAAMLELTAWLAGKLGLEFSIDSFFWDALLAAVIITLISWGLNSMLGSKKS